MGRRRKDAMPSLSDTESPAQRNCANERERDRMRVLSKAFTKLKTTLPWVPPDTKLSKLDTLRLATCYIAHLRQILADDEPDDISALSVTSFAHDMDTEDCLGLQNGGGQYSCDMTVALRSRPDADNKVNSAGEAVYAHPLSLTWPFNFNGRYNVSVSTHDLRGPSPQVTRSDRGTHNSHTSSAVNTQKVHMSR